MEILIDATLKAAEASLLLLWGFCMARVTLLLIEAFSSSCAARAEKIKRQLHSTR